jgi:hypothetical protein
VFSIGKNGTIQKDWTVVACHELPEVFGIVVHGHEGWDRQNPDATAKFALVVSFEVLGAEVQIYEQIRHAVEVETPVRTAEVKIAQ